MTTITADTRSSSTGDRDRARRALVPVAIASLLVAVFFDLARADSPAESMSMVVLGLIVVALVYPLVVARGLRRDSAGGRALTLGVLGVLLLVPAFWSGLPMILGAAAALLGYAGRRGRSGSGLAIAALVLGALSMIGYLAIYVSDWVSNPGANWWF